MPPHMPYFYTAIAAAVALLCGFAYYLSHLEGSESKTNLTSKRNKGVNVDQVSVVQASKNLSVKRNDVGRRYLLRWSKEIFRSLRSRDDIGAMLERFGLETGAELGVQQGVYSAELLRHWPTCKRFYLVDAWTQQKNYLDDANQPNDIQESYFTTAKHNLEPWKNKTTFLRMFTTEAAKIIPDGSLDFVFVDARHDYCGVMKDIRSYWPKVQVGGVLAGHDYYDPPPAIPGMVDYTVCADGTRRTGGTKGAVDDFANENGLHVTATPDDMWIFIRNV